MGIMETIWAFDFSLVQNASVETPNLSAMSFDIATEDFKVMNSLIYELSRTPFVKIKVATLSQ